MRLDLAELLSSGDHIKLLKQMSIDEIFVFSIHRNLKPEICYCDIPSEMMKIFRVVLVHESGGRLEFYGHWKTVGNEDIMKWIKLTQDDVRVMVVPAK